MACRALLLAGLLALGSAIEECPADATALHQAKLSLRTAAQKPQLVTPSKSQTSKVRPELRSVVEGLVKRTTTKAKLPSVPAVFRWELVGKATKWALEQYQKPRTAASMELLEGIIDMAAEVAGSEDFASEDDMELMEKLSNVTRFHQMFRHYVEQSGLPEAVGKLVDAYAEAAKAGKEIDKEAAYKIFVDVANETNGPAMADLVEAMINTKSSADVAHICDLYVPVVLNLGGPPSLKDFLDESATMIRSGKPVDTSAEQLRFEAMLAKAARELNLPSAIADALDFVVEMHNASVPAAYYKEHPKEAEALLKRMYDIFAKLIEQLGGPQSLGTMMRTITQPSEHTETEFLSLAAASMREMQLPAVYSELFDYMSKLSTHREAMDPVYVTDLFHRLGEVAGVPEPIMELTHEMFEMEHKIGKDADKKLKLQTKLFTKMLKALGLPAFAEIFAKVGGPMLKGKKPDALALATLAPTMTKVMPDLEALAGLAHEQRAKLLSPLGPIFDRAVEKITGNMPQSALKEGLHEVLSKVKPH